MRAQQFHIKLPVLFSITSLSVGTVFEVSLSC